MVSKKLFFGLVLKKVFEKKNVFFSLKSILKRVLILLVMSA
jgi:hypothetical protein